MAAGFFAQHAFSVGVILSLRRICRAADMTVTAVVVVRARSSGLKFFRMTPAWWLCPN
jgi:hypothetical protein